MLRRCIDCAEQKSDKNFNNRTSNGATYKMAVCKECEKVRQQGYYRLRKLLHNLTRR